MGPAYRLIDVGTRLCGRFLRCSHEPLHGTRWIFQRSIDFERLRFARVPTKKEVESDRRLNIQCPSLQLEERGEKERRGACPARCATALNAIVLQMSKDRNAHFVEASTRYQLTLFPFLTAFLRLSRAKRNCFLVNACFRGNRAIGTRCRGCFTKCAVETCKWPCDVRGRILWYREDCRKFWDIHTLTTAEMVI